MARTRTRLANAIALLVLWGCTSSPMAPDAVATAAAAPAAAAGIPAGIVDLTNVERDRAGVAPLKANTQLMRAAQLQADQMAAIGRLDHVLPDGPYPQPTDRLKAAGYRWQAYAENVALGQNGAAGAVEGWMDSSGHRRNMLSATYTEIGTGYAKDRSGRPYYVQVFGKPML